MKSKDDSSNNTEQFIDLFNLLSSFADTNSDLDYGLKRITKHPYYKDTNTGNYIYFANDSITQTERLEISNRFIFENTSLYGNHLNVGIRSIGGLSLEVDYLQLWENRTNADYNTLAIATGLFKYHFIREERIDLWAGLGKNYIAGEIDDWGYVIATGGELFFMNPLSLEINLQLAATDNDNLYTVTTLLNCHRKNWVFSAGLEYFWIGDIPFRTFSVSLGTFL
ncbi:hypothetical protein [Aquimarina algicola]|nr:hypothetical protein [Aquimarina algicola]